MSFNPKKFNKLITKLTLEKGLVKLERSSPFGWSDWRAQQHLESCSWSNLEGKVAESDHWGEFEGTEADNSWHEGWTIHGLSCACGELKNRSLRFEGKGSVMLEALIDLIPEENI